MFAKQANQPVLKQARALSSSFIFLSWTGPINHPGGFKYRIYWNEGSSTVQNQIEFPAIKKDYFLHNLEENVMYTICVGIVDNLYGVRRTCDNIAKITTPAERGMLSNLKCNCF